MPETTPFHSVASPASGHVDSTTAMLNPAPIAGFTGCFTRGIPDSMRKIAGPETTPTVMKKKSQRDLDWRHAGRTHTGLMPGVLGRQPESNQTLRMQSVERMHGESSKSFRPNGDEVRASTGTFLQCRHSAQSWPVQQRLSNLQRENRACSCPGAVIFFADKSSMWSFRTWLSDRLTKNMTMPCRV